MTTFWGGFGQAAAVVVIAPPLTRHGPAGAAHVCVHEASTVTRSGRGMTRKAACAGFTLIETIVVLVILGLALSIVAGFLPRRNATLELSAATSRVTGALRLARSRAMAESRPVPFALVPDRHGFRLDDAAVALGPSVTVVMAQPRIVFAQDGSTVGWVVARGGGWPATNHPGRLAHRSRRRRRVMADFAHSSRGAPGTGGFPPWRTLAAARREPRTGLDDECGFTLLEVLIAFAIASIALAVLVPWRGRWTARISPRAPDRPGGGTGSLATGRCLPRGAADAGRPVRRRWRWISLAHPDRPCRDGDSSAGGDGPARATSTRGSVRGPGDGTPGRERRGRTRSRWRPGVCQSAGRIGHDKADQHDPIADFVQLHVADFVPPPTSYCHNSIRMSRPEAGYSGRIIREPVLPLHVGRTYLLVDRADARPRRAVGAASAGRSKDALILPGLATLARVVHGAVAPAQGETALLATLPADAVGTSWREAMASRQRGDARGDRRYASRSWQANHPADRRRGQPAERCLATKWTG